VKFIKILSLVLVLSSLCAEALANNDLQKMFMERAGKYADAVGAISLVEKVVAKINSECDSNITLPPKAINEADYLLRKKSSYKYSEFVKLFEDPSETQKLVDAATDQILAQIPGCSYLGLANWQQKFVNHTIEISLDTLRNEDYLFGLPKINRDEEKVLKEFNAKLKSYQDLPNAEIDDLATALEWGSYSYAALTLIENLEKDQKKALELRQYVANESQDPKDLYELGKTQEKSDKKAALNYFKKSAELGYKYAEIWLGTYYACQSNKINALYWLNKARPKDPEYISDIILEIEELGMPTNCYEGWVY